MPGADVRQFREIVTKKIEEKRERKEIGSSLAAELDIQAHGPIYESLARLGDELRFVLITSRATVHRGKGLRVQVKVKASAASEMRALLALPRRRERGGAVRPLREQPARRRASRGAMPSASARWFGLSAAGDRCWTT